MIISILNWRSFSLMEQGHGHFGNHIIKSYLTNKEPSAVLNHEIQLYVFHTSLPFYATQIINLLLNSRILANHDKVVGLSASNAYILIKGIVPLL